MDHISEIYFLIDELYEININKKSPKDSNEITFKDAKIDEKTLPKDSNNITFKEAKTENILIKEKTENILIKENEEPLEQNKYWSITCLPLSYYLVKMQLNPRFYLYKMSIAESLDIFKIPTKKFSSLLTKLDIFLIQNIKPADLLVSEIMYLKNKNYGLINFISGLLKNEKHHYYFIRVLKNLLKRGNHNSAECIKTAFLRHKLDKKIFNNLKKIDERVHTDNYDYIPPFNVIIKDLEDSNNNKNHEEASIRFCNIVEKFLILQNKKIKINKKYEHFLLYKIYTNLYVKEEIEKNDLDDYLFLYL